MLVMTTYECCDLLQQVSFVRYDHRWFLWVMTTGEYCEIWKQVSFVSSQITWCCWANVLAMLSTVLDQRWEHNVGPPSNSTVGLRWPNMLTAVCIANAQIHGFICTWTHNLMEVLPYGQHLSILQHVHSCIMFGSHESLRLTSSSQKRLGQSWPNMVCSIFSVRRLKIVNFITLPRGGRFLRESENLWYFLKILLLYPQA